MAGDSAGLWVPPKFIAVRIGVSWQLSFFPMQGFQHIPPPTGIVISLRQFRGWAVSGLVSLFSSVKRSHALSILMSSCTLWEGVTSRLTASTFFRHVPSKDRREGDSARTWLTHLPVSRRKIFPWSWSRNFFLHSVASHNCKKTDKVNGKLLACLYSGRIFLRC